MAEAMASQRRKKQILLENLERLWDDYKTAKSQAINALSAVDRNKIDREADEIYQRIEKLEAEINSLELATPSTDATPAPAETGRRNDLILDALPEIDFKTLEQTIQTILEEHSDHGCAALLLLRRSKAMKGELGAQRVRRILKGSTGEGLFRHYPLKFSAWETSDATAFLGGLGKHLGITQAPADLTSFSESVVETLCRSLCSGSVVLIECQNCDDLLVQADVFRSLIEEFWASLVRAVATAAEDIAEIRIVLLLLAENDLADTQLAAHCCCTLDRFRRDHLLEIALEEWTPKDIGAWIGRYSGLNMRKPEIDQKAKTLHNRYKGNPENIAQALLNLCCPPQNG